MRNEDEGLGGSGVWFGFGLGTLGMALEGLRKGSRGVASHGAKPPHRLAPRHPIGWLAWRPILVGLVQGIPQLIIMRVY